ncbi:MAG TPA: glucose-1-phosphate adenylyltransferase subunit GlgD [Clostridiales bacterium]|nr:MAG: glucose-1-phosphate adenylyltransferase subunit GlgD [Clostridiales bacterium GWD2_32_59]HAN10186.1 glucose-1-phosphate adenylyltransferase subunit GlgD [Clostridiales bacterium]
MKFVGIILASSKNEKLEDLASERAMASLPIASCYKAIDFTLSNMANSGIKKVAVITQYNSRSLLNHLSSAKIWELGTKQGGLFVFTPSVTKDNAFEYKGTADALYQNIIFLKRSQEPYVLIGAGHHIYKMDYREVLKYHINNNADMTIISKEMVKNDELSSYGIMKLDSDNRVIEFEEKPLDPETNIASLGIYIVKRTLLIEILEQVISEGRYDFVTDVIAKYRKKLKIYAYLFDGYWSNIRTVKKYYDTNMDFLKFNIRKQMLLDYPSVATRIKDDPPAKYNHGAKVKNCLISGGSIIEGEVKNSVLFSRVCVGAGAIVSDSIIMNDSYIGKNCLIENAILDKQVIISDNQKIIGTKENPIILKKGAVV